VKAGKKVKVSATITVAAGGATVPLPGAQLRVAGKSAKTGATGTASVTVKLARGSYRAQGFFKGLRTATAKLRAT
jgi:hypothetical protein